jgi:hypothetical protein
MEDLENMELGELIDKLYASEINCSVSTMWDAGMHVQLGDELNGFVAETWVNTSAEAAGGLMPRCVGGIQARFMSAERHIRAKNTQTEITPDDVAPASPGVVLLWPLDSTGLGFKY